MLREVRFRDDKDFSGCSIFGMMNVRGERFNGEPMITAISNMKERSNGLGGGFAAYGIYPQYAELYCFHMMYDDQGAREETEEFFKSRFDVEGAEVIPTRPCEGVDDPPLLWRYFLRPRESLVCSEREADDFVVQAVMHINVRIEGAFVFSSGKNMGVFKGVGFPEDIGRFFRLEDYEGYTWVAHGRFPTNTQGWWGGAHPFNILDWSVVHNGEISSYGINRRYLEMFGYICTLHTDTEVIAYGVDLLLRKHGLTVEDMARVFAAPLWTEIDRMPPREREVHTALRQTYGSLLLNGPFSIIISNRSQMIGLTDRIRLRPLVAGRSGEFMYISSEEAPIHLVDDGLQETWIPQGGEPIIAELAEKMEEIETKGAEVISLPASDSA
ncbi:glutamine amidotransferase family protein [Candidatus Solincola tengchongensis]|uniref:class II glutamine amidotransferase n=1 Tax=Candidatus Solincola tengchongensis TaxID=2900693 RepID=UPI0025808620|nr:glutamine amidotransferase family protein [Candidatus Solincola tengchongensis]